MLFTRVGEVAVVSAAVFGPQASSAEEILRQLLQGEPTDSSPRLPPGDLSVASGLPRREVRKLDRFSLAAVAAARQALHASELSAAARLACGVLTGNVLAGWTFTEPQLEALWQEGPRGVNPYLATAWFPAAPQGQITIHLGLRGYAKTITTDRVAGAQAVAMAYERVLQGRDPWLLAGGVEAPCTPLVEEAWRLAGHPERLEEGAAYLLLGPADASPVRITGHAECSFRPAAGAPLEALSPLLDTLVPEARGLGIVIDAPAELSADDLDRELDAHPVTRPLRRLHRSRVFGEALAASAGQTLAAAFAWASGGPRGSTVLVLALSRRSGHLFVFRHADGTAAAAA